MFRRFDSRCSRMYTDFREFRKYNLRGHKRLLQFSQLIIRPRGWLKHGICISLFSDLNWVVAVRLPTLIR
jgi:hypothetical protein